MTRWIRPFRLGLLLVCLFASVQTFAIDVEMPHSVYRFLDRCELKNLLDAPLSGSRPYSRRAVGCALLELEDHRAELSRIERKQLDHFLYEFGDDLPKGSEISESAQLYAERLHKRGHYTPWKQFDLYKDGRYIYCTRGDDYLAAFLPHLDMGVEHIDGETSGTLTRNAPGFQVYGYFKNFGLHAAARDAYLNGDTELADPLRYPVRFNAEGQERGEEFEFDESDALLSYEIPYAYLLFGKTYNRWGRGMSGSLSLSDYSSTYSQLRYRFHFGPLEVTGLHGKLQPYPIKADTLEDNSIKRYFPEKWIAGHRYQVDVSPRIQLGLYDMIVYGNRPVDWDYVTPLTFLWSAEHYNHDRDNVQMGIDFRLLLGKRISLYGQWHLDELQFSNQFTDWFGNKHGYMLGLRQADPFGVTNADAAVEMLIMRPYMYTHQKSWNTFQHYGKHLGYQEQPNTLVLFGTWHQTLRRNLESWVDLRHVKHGMNTATKNVGGDSMRPHDHMNDSEDAPFLDGDLENTNEITVGVSWEISYQLFLDGHATLSQITLEPETGTSSDRLDKTFCVSLRWHPYRWR